MKGKHILFLAIPAMMLASCGGNLGTEVTDSSAINDMLSNVATKSEDVKNFKFVVDMNGTSYDKEAKKNVTSKSHIVYERNEDEEVHCKTESEKDKEKQDIDYYVVKNTTYQQVMYVDTYEDEDKTDSKNGEHTILCYGYEGHELDFSFGAMYTTASFTSPSRNSDSCSPPPPSTRTESIPRWPRARMTPRRSTRPSAAGTLST